MAKTEANRIISLVACGRQFIQDAVLQLRSGYSDEVKALCLRMYVNGSGFRAIERVTGVHHTTVISWVKLVGQNLPDTYDPDQTPQVGELSGTRNIYRLEKNKIWIWTAVDHFQTGILGWVIGDHSAKTFAPLWAIVATWQCYFYVTDSEAVAT